MNRIDQSLVDELKAAQDKAAEGFWTYPDSDWQEAMGAESPSLTRSKKMNKSNMKESIMQSYYAGGFADSSSFKAFVSEALDMIDLNTVDQKQLERFISNWCDVA